LHKKCYRSGNERVRRDEWRKIFREYKKILDNKTKSEYKINKKEVLICLLIEELVRVFRMLASNRGQEIRMELGERSAVMWAKNTENKIDTHGRKGEAK
jgi:hypothetical protein